MFQKDSRNNPVLLVQWYLSQQELNILTSKFANTTNLKISYNVVVKNNYFFAFPLSFKIISFQVFGKAWIICNQYILWVSLRWSSIFKSCRGFIFPLSSINKPIKFKFLSEKKKMHRLTVNLNIWVKPIDIRQEHG